MKLDSYLFFFSSQNIVLGLFLVVFVVVVVAETMSQHIPKYSKVSDGETRLEQFGMN